MNEVLPADGATGQWRLKAPFDTKIVNGLAYTCYGKNTIGVLNAQGVEVFAEYYEKNGIDRDTYELHAKEDRTICTLLSSAGDWLQIPSPYLSGWPSADVVPYVVVGMFLTLGALPNTIDPSFLTDKVKNVVKASLGLEPDVEYIAMTEITHKEWSLHESLEQARKTATADDNSDLARRLKAEDDLIAAKVQIAALQQYIIDSGIGP